MIYVCAQPSSLDCAAPLGEVCELHALRERDKTLTEALNAAEIAFNKIADHNPSCDVCLAIIEWAARQAR